MIAYDFYCNIIKTPFGDNADLLCTNTDLLLLEITTSNVYNLSSRSSPSQHQEQESIGKDECAGRPIAHMWVPATKDVCSKVSWRLKAPSTDGQKV